MNDIRHRVGIKASVRKVYEAIQTIEGLRHWWVSETAGEAQRGGVIRFGFVDLKVVALRPHHLVKWKCVRGPKEWVGTEITFVLKRRAGQTFVLFTHAGWKKPVEFMHHCSTKWATFLLSMRDWLERGEGRPAPYDLKIHVGD
jgi:uncharacterized protein YndB with AHSA1/START domain